MSGLSLKTQIDYDKVFKEGQRYSDRTLNFILIAGTGSSRLGVVVNKKYGGAVERNRVKRKLREAFRKAMANFKVPSEIVVIPKLGAKKAEYGDLMAELMRIAQKAGIL